MGEDFRDLSRLDDVTLLELARGGDDGAFLTLYRRRQGKLYRFSMQMSGSRSIAEDVTQEVFLALMREPQRYDPDRGSLEAFLYGVARNHVLRRLGAERRYVPINDDDGDSGDSFDQAQPGDPHQDMARAETIESVRRAILSLPEHYREVVVLCELHEMSYLEASAALGCAVGTVRSRLHRARKMLLEKLKPEAEPEVGTDDVKSARCVV
jgi:RNA polymerase sigma-70 factor (ECF subfamily)